MNTKLAEKLKNLPNSAGVYFHKNSKDEIIYVGKAANLKNRVRQYFQNSRGKDSKTQALVAEIAMTDWIEVETEMDALFLESEMIKRYKPQPMCELAFVIKFRISVLLKIRLMIRRNILGRFIIQMR